MLNNFKPLTHFEFDPDQSADYLPLHAYSLIGDNRTAILVGADGNIGWGCFPNFDNDSVFASILDPDAGMFRICPTKKYTSHQRYETETNILVTEMITTDGAIRIRDFMAIAHGRILPTAEIHRIVEGVAGTVELEVVFQPAFNYASEHPQYQISNHGVLSWTSTRRASVSSAVPMAKTDHGVSGRFKINAGNEVMFVFDWNAPSILPVESYRSDRRLHEARNYWIRWVEQFEYFGRYRDHAVRSLLAIKLLCYEPTGAIIAAPTTSLPEWIGGSRNWDYRYSWVRDSSFILCALFRSGFVEEGASYIDWLLSRVLDTEDWQLNVFYGIRDSADDKVPPETELPLRGYRDSKPVRIGNGAADQFQLDIYGSLIDAAYQYDLYGGSLTAREWTMLQKLVEIVRQRWQLPDQGIWEARNEPRHYTYSKLWAWTALDRGIKLAKRLKVKAPVSQWQETADEIYTDILKNAWNNDLQSFTAVYHSTDLDASLLIMPTIGFIEADDARFESTTKAILKHLSAGPFPLLYRYLSEDGINEKEGAFLLPSFWLVQNYALAGNIAKARETLEALLRLTSPTGLYGEEYDAASSEILGNYPQGFSHLGMLQATLEIEIATQKLRNNV